MKHKNLLDLFWKRAAEHRQKTFLRFEKRPGGDFQEMSWNEVATYVQEIAHGLKALGIDRTDKVALISRTCHYWLCCDFGIISLGAITVPVYPTLQSDSVAFIMKHSDSSLAFVRNKMQLQKIREHWQDLPMLKYVVVMEDRGDIPNNDPKIITLNDLRRLGRDNLKQNPDLIPQRIDEIDLDDLASIIYTSGTTGQPKGVMLSHRNFLTAALSFYQYVPLDEGDGMLPFLPLSHIFERVGGQFYGTDQAIEFTYCEKIDHLPRMLLKAKSTCLLSVPRVMEKIHDRIMFEVHNGGVFRRAMVEAALSVSIKYYKKKLAKEKIGSALRLQNELAQSLVLSRIRKMVFPNLKVVVVGGAPFSQELIYFYCALGLTIVEGYGLTETSAPVSVNPFWANKPGTVGVPFSHFQVKIAEDGEILCKGPAVSQGYYNDPEATSRSFRDGWFCTGDLGEFDKEGYLKITGRKKELIITSSGKNIAPHRVETTLLESEYISQIVVIGDNEKYLAALVVINRGEVRKYLELHGLEFDPDKDFNECPEIIRLIEHELNHYGKFLSRYEQVKAFKILQHELTVESGELTPTLKTRRHVIMERHKDLIAPLFKKSKPRIQ